MTNGEFGLSNIYVNENSLQKGITKSKIQFNFANIQTKLKVSQPNDIYEQEANLVAEQIMRMPKSFESYLPINPSADTKVNRKCKSCEEEDESKKIKLNRKDDSSFKGLDISSDVTDYLSNIATEPGSHLDNSTEEFMESRFGYDFSKVRIHSDSEAAQSASSVNALTYTLGDHIVFGDGQYQPDSMEE